MCPPQTGVEAAGELTDFINQDLRKLYPERARAMRVTLIEAREVLGSFDRSLREYAAQKLIQRGVELRKGAVKCMDESTITLQVRSGREGYIHIYIHRYVAM